MKILIPTDFSDNARVALNYALTLFGDDQPAVTLLNTWQVPHTGVGMLVSIEDLLKDESERAMKELMSDIDSQAQGDVQLEGVVRQGGLVEVIRSMMKKDHYDMIVMGTHGADDVKKKLLGSNTSNVVRTSRIPVLVVPLDADPSHPSKVALATDFTSMNTNQVEVLSGIIRKFNAEFEAVHVEREVALSKGGHVNDWSQPFNDLRPVFIKIVADDVAEGLDQYMEENRVDLLAVVRHDYGFFEGLLHKSVSRALCMYTDRPLLILPE